MVTATLNHLWQSTIIAAGLILIASCLARYSASVRYRLWFLASLKFLIPISWLYAFERLIRLLPGHIGPAPPLLRIAIAPFREAFPFVQGVLSEPELLSANSTLSGSDAARLWASVSSFLPEACLALWICGSVLILARWGYRWVQTREIVYQSDLLPIAAAISVRSSSLCPEPGIVGVIQPVLMLPQGIEERLNAEQLDAIVQHELAHCRRRDNFTAAVQMLVEAAFWFYPLVWWLGRRMLRDREAACDEAVLARGHRADTYAETILAVCRLYVKSGTQLASGVAGADLRRRVETIMAPQPARQLGPTGAVIVALVATVAVSLPVTVFAALDGPPGNAEQHPLAASRSQSRNLLMAGRYAEIESRMSGLQRAYESGSLDDYTLLQQFYAFMAPDRSLQYHLDAWISEYPNSYAAHVARGIFFFGYGLQTRGNRLAAHTTQEQMRGMQAYLQTASADLKPSIALTSKPMVTYNLLIRMAMEYGHGEEARSYLSAALALDPQAFIARRPYMRSLESRWGGDIGKMESFLEASRSAGLTPAQIQALTSIVREERLWLTRWSVQAGDTAVDRD